MRVIWVQAFCAPLACLLSFSLNDEFSDYYEILEHMDPFSPTYFSVSEESARPVKLQGKN